MKYMYPALAKDYRLWVNMAKYILANGEQYPDHKKVRYKYSYDPDFKPGQMVANYTHWMEIAGYKVTALAHYSTPRPTKKSKSSPVRYYTVKVKIHVHRLFMIELSFRGGLLRTSQPNYDPSLSDSIVCLPHNRPKEIYCHEVCTSTYSILYGETTEEDFENVTALLRLGLS